MAEKNVLITGAGGNLGKTVVRKFSEHDYTIIATVSPGKKLDLSNPRIKSYPVDLTSELAVSELVSAIYTERKHVHAALLLAGGFEAGNIHNTTGNSLRRQYELNFETAFNMAKAVFTHMVDQPEGGRIILIGSRPSLFPKEGKNAIAYALSKSLLFKLAEILNAEGQAKNVITSVIVPGTIDTPANRKDMPDADFSKWVSPEEIAETMLFLCSGKANAWRDPVIKMFGRS